jgi:hypothetical protein
MLRVFEDYSFKEIEELVEDRNYFYVIREKVVRTNQNFEPKKLIQFKMEDGKWTPWLEVGIYEMCMDKYKGNLVEESEVFMILLEILMILRNPEDNEEQKE